MQKHKFTSRLVFLVTVLMLSSQTQAGLYYEYITTNQSQGSRKADVVTYKTTIDGDRTRIEFESDINEGPLRSGNYMVSTDGGKTSYLVDPADETYGRFDFQSLMASVKQAQQSLEQLGMKMEIKVSDVSSQKLLEEAGESMHGYSTTHLQYQTAYTLSMKIAFVNKQYKQDIVRDVWSTPDIETEAFRSWISPGQTMSTGNDEIDKLVQAQNDEMKGFPLKMVMQSTMTKKNGKQQKSTSTIEVTVIHEASPAAAQFTWPDHYEEVEVMPSMADNDTAKEEGEEKEGGLSKLKGMFKKKDSGNN